MGRHEQREQVFLLLFRAEFHSPEDMPEQVKLFLEDNEAIVLEKDAAYVSGRCGEIQDKLPEIDRILDAKTEGWDTKRMGKVELTVLRIAAYEILFDKDIPEGVAINEAVEIAKKYGQETSGRFVNAILAKLIKTGDSDS
nr:transcription antitermination factor NusB [uncultured Acetatifactor sp.]